jgi:lipopolysaccharide transport system permease protein
LFYLSGIVFWNYFSGALNGTANTFVSNAGIFGKVYFPRLVSPISIVISNLLQFFIQLGLLFGFMIIFKIRGANFAPNSFVFVIPYLVFLMAILGLGFGIIISSLTTKYRDLTNLVAFGVQLWMYATPVIYPINSVPEKFRAFVALNPVSPIIELCRYALLGGTYSGTGGLWYSSVFAVVVLAIGVVLFNKVEQSFMDTV